MESLPVTRRRLLRQMALASAAAAVAPSMSAFGKVSPGRSTNVFLNQVGYLPKAAKFATYALQTKSSGVVAGFDTNAFRVRSIASGKVVFEGQLAGPLMDAASGDMARAADFSAVQEPGKYRLELNDGKTISDPFEIHADVYAEALRLTMRAYYGQRCGCKVDLGGGYTHPACHLDGAFHKSSGKSGKAGNHGGWHDAGDYGRYVVNSGITCGTLLYAWEMYPRATRRLSMDILESGGKTPDFLAEVRWNLEWMLSMQDADGGVWHKQTSEQFCGFVMPQDDDLTSYVIGTGTAPYKSTGATADLSAVMAIAARCYGQHDDAFAKRCLTAAEQAFAWAVAHPSVTFTNPRGIGTGGYDDGDTSDETLWAAAELFRTTGKDEYEEAFLNGFSKAAANLKIDAPGWGDVAPMAYWAYASSNRAKSSHVQEQIRQATQTTARELIARCRASGYGNTLAAEDYVWGSNAVAGNQSLLLLMAHHFEANPEAVEAALGNLHYLLGRNCLGVSWVTQLGVRPFQHPHHRPSAADGIAAPWPGLLSGGPNRRPGDAVARTLPKSPPMRMWVDDERAYSLNEIAINWNAPLVFVLAAANELL